MNRSRNNQSSSYSSSRSGLPNSSNRNFNNLNRDHAYRSDYQPKYNSNDGYDDVQYGRGHEESNRDESLGSYQNEQNPQYGANDHYRKGNSFNTNLGADQSSNQYSQQNSNQAYGEAGRYGGNENYADRGYSQQAGGWGRGREASSNVGRYTGGNSWHEDQHYPSTERFSSRDSQSQWQGNPSSNSSYGADWNSQGMESQNTGSHAGRGPKNYKRSDERIHEDAAEALTNAPHVDASEIEVDVKEGVLTLSGTISDKRAKRAAEECVENISGVKDVKNNLSVSSASASTHLEGDKSTKKPSANTSKLQ